MTISSVDSSVVTDALIAFLRDTADLSLDESGNVGNIRVGDHAAPNLTDDEDELDVMADIELVAGTIRPYLVVYSIPTGGSADRRARAGYASGTPSSRVLRFQITACGPTRRACQSLANTAVGRICDVAGDRQYAPIPLIGHEITRRERIGEGIADRQGSLFQWSEVIELDVSLALAP